MSIDPNFSYEGVIAGIFPKSYAKACRIDLLPCRRNYGDVPYFTFYVASHRAPHAQFGIGGRFTVIFVIPPQPVICPREFGLDANSRRARFPSEELVPPNKRR